MGEFRFYFPDAWELDSTHANVIHVVGLEGVPWPCRVQLSEKTDGDHQARRLLTVTFNQELSGRVYVVSPFENWGELLVCTATVTHRDEPYDLLTELARGTLNRIRNQVSIWVEGGLTLSDQIHDRIRKATTALGNAIFCGDADQGALNAASSLDTSMGVLFEVAEEFGVQVSGFRRANNDFEEFWVANSIRPGFAIPDAEAHDLFDLVEVGPSNIVFSDPPDSQGKSEDELGVLRKRLIHGPWLDTGIGGMRQDYLDEPDFESRSRRILADCRGYLEEMHTETSLLHVACGLNGMGHRYLSYPQQLQLTVDMLRLVEEGLVETPTMISFDFPWGERLAGAVGGVHSIQIADTLLRQGVSLSFLGLDINLDYWPNGSFLRDPFQWIDLIDIWAQLGVPLVLCLRAPCWPKGDGPVLKNSGADLRLVSDRQRIEFLKTILPMMVARPSIHGVIWRQWRDDDDPRYPSGGLVDEQGNPKPMIEALERMRKIIAGP